jgi:hypothetical protein
MSQQSKHLDEVTYVDAKGNEHVANVSKVYPGSKNLVDVVYEADGRVQTASAVPLHLKGMSNHYFKPREAK